MADNVPKVVEAQRFSDAVREARERGPDPGARVACPECRDRRKLQSGEAYEATCGQCGARTTVPFPPRPDRPLYCRPCFAARRGTG